MEITEEIEFEQTEDTILFGKDIKTNDPDIIQVTFEAFPQWENDGIGGYEYWGAPGYDKGHDYVSLESKGDPTWDKKAFTKEENKIIEAFTNHPNFLILINKFCDQYRDECERENDF